MATFLKKANNASTTIATDVASGDGTIVVTSVATLPATFDYHLTIWDDSTYTDPGDDSNAEIVKVTSAAGTTLTVTRAQESTSAVTHDTGDAVALLLTKAQSDEWEAAINTHAHVAGDGGALSAADPIKIVIDSAGNVGLTVKAAASQTANLQVWTDNSDANMTWITAEGTLQTDAGVKASANEWGDSFAGWDYGGFTAEHTITDNKGNYDYTGGSAEQLFTDTTNSPFTSTDATNGNWIVITSGAKCGAMAEIEEYIDADNVTLHTHSWDADLTNVDYSIYPAPQFIVGDGFSTEVHVGTTGAFHVANSGGGFTEHAMLELDALIAADHSDAFHLHVDAAGHGNVDAIQIFYETGALQAADHNQVLQISVDESGATAGNLALIFLETTEVQSNLEKQALHVGTGFDIALHVSGAAAADPDYGYENTTDRVNGAAGDGNAFLEAGNDLQIWDAANEYILIGDDATFEVIEIILATGSSKSLALEWYYSQANGVWVEFFPDDSTQNGTMSGLADWNTTELTGWAKSDSSVPDATDLTNAYYIKVVRTRVGDPPTMPVEDFFKLYASQATGMEIRGDGVVTVPYLAGAPASLANGMIWMEADGVHLYRGGVEKTVTDS